MKVEDHNALRFILQDDIYLLEEDKLIFDNLPTSQAEIKTPEINFNYLGTNKKNFLVLVSYPQHDFMANDHLTALESVLTRKGYSRDDVAIFNITSHQADYTQLLVFFKPQVLLVLGQESVPPGIDPLKLNQVEKRGDLTLLYTFSFGEMMTNTDNKKAFWEQVKTL